MKTWHFEVFCVSFQNLILIKIICFSQLKLRSKKTQELSETEAGTLDVTNPEMKFVARRPTKQQDSQLHDTIFSSKTAARKNDMESWFCRCELIKMKGKANAKCLHPDTTHSFQLTLTHSRSPRSAVDRAQWIERWTSNPDITGSNPAEDDSGFRCFSLFQKFTCIENCLGFTQNRIQMSDDEISSSERPKNYATKKAQ